MAIQGLRTTVKKINGDSLTPVMIFKRLPGANKFLFESASLQDGIGRYSIIGSNPRKSYVGHGDQVVETVLATSKTYTHQGELFTLLKRLMPRVVNNSELPFVGGAVGYIASGATQMQAGLEDELALPDVYFNVYDTVIVFDHLVDDITIMHTNIDPEIQEPNLDELANLILNGETAVDEGYELSSFTSDVSAEAFEQLAVEAQQALKENQSSQIVISRRLQASFKGNAFDLYRTLRKREASPYMYYVECGDHTVIGTSPASLVKVTGNQVQASPVAGTIPRGKDAAEDVQQEQLLLQNEVEVKRHHVLVKETMKDLEKVTLRDTVKSTDSLRPVRFPAVIHLVTQLQATLLPMLHGLDALAACLPAVATTGVPKWQAADTVAKLENKHRSFYGGAVGFIGFNGNLNFALTIRTMLVKENVAYTQVGATISENSDTAVQFDDTERKIALLTHLHETQGQEA